jgi:uncharacterized pyridoxal phosphate-containing UPF0001 family protein
MSSDLGLAIKAQSTIIRIGRDLFGERVWFFSYHLHDQ